MEKVKYPNKPKRPSSAFFIFMEEFRKQYKQKHPHIKSVAAVGKAGGDKWKSLSDAEKAPYVAKADERKAEYEKDMKAYHKRRAEGTKEGAEESKKSRSELIIKEEDHEGSDEEEDDNFAFRIMEKVKYPNKPKRPSSAFFIFMEEFRKQYKQKHPQIKSVAAVGKAGGDKWKSLSDAEKAPYVAKADERKAEYEKNMKAYNERLQTKMG
ncbi:high mobility group B protein 3-like isoform X2 [Rhodamnia argentea]|uniref:High mobility group B protein 3-like isoform X2 n=1 Tax=Rhodamnia argentea TaxID=178133 RepID=A0ABM3GV64_9MYRT|nr:high mobility group B protein 3-like isoform X2 [Rhodamnia argentea]